MSAKYYWRLNPQLPRLQSDAVLLYYDSFRIRHWYFIINYNFVYYKVKSCFVISCPFPKSSKRPLLLWASILNMRNKIWYGFVSISNFTFNTSIHGTSIKFNFVRHQPVHYFEYIWGLFHCTHHLALVGSGHRSTKGRRTWSCY